MARPPKRIKDIKFSLRLPPSFYERLKAASEARDVPMNEVVKSLVDTLPKLRKVE